MQYVQLQNFVIYHETASLYVTWKQDWKTGTINAVVIAVPIQFISSNFIYLPSKSMD